MPSLDHFKSFKPLKLPSATLTNHAQPNNPLISPPSPTQPQPQPQPQPLLSSANTRTMSSLPQPLLYPQPVSPQPVSSSKGSFGPVFVVLAVIAVLAMIACFISRLCARRFAQQMPRQNRTHATGDIEFGFETGIPKAKPIGKGGPRGEAKHADIEFRFEAPGPKAKLAGRGPNTEATPAKNRVLKGDATAGTPSEKKGERSSGEK